MFYQEANLRAAFTPSGMMFRDAYGRFTTDPLHALKSKAQLDAEAQARGVVAIASLVVLAGVGLVRAAPHVVSGVSYAADAVASAADSAYTSVVETVGSWF